jgi:transposase
MTTRTVAERTDGPASSGQVAPRHALSNEAWGRVRSIFDRRVAGTGRPPVPARRVLDGVLWILATGAPWRDLPRSFGPWQTIYGRFRAWSSTGLLDRALRRLQLAATVMRGRSSEVWCVDTTVVRASRAAAGARRSRDSDEPRDHALGRSRGGFGTKVALVCDGRGTPLAAQIGPGQEHDLQRLRPTVRAALSLGRRPRRLTADKAYSVAWVRSWLRRRRIAPVIPTRSDQPADEAFDARTYRRRNVVERLVGWLKESRRVATRYDKLATTFLAFVKLALLRRLLRMAEFSNTT